MSRGGARAGAGRPPSRTRAEDYRSVDVRKLARQDMLRGGPWAGRWVQRTTGRVLATLQLEVGPDHLDLTYAARSRCASTRVELTSSACHLGGARAWFCCPVCGHRVALLLLGGQSIACRRCVATTYLSQRVDFCRRTWIRQRKLEGRLEPGLTRPPGMLTEVYSRVLVGIQRCQRRRANWLASAMVPVNDQLIDLRWQVHALTRGIA
jgi:hypothetical protein